MDRGQPLARAASPMTRRLVDTLYTEAMLIADEARGYFDVEGPREREALDPVTRVGFSCEALKVTTRLMHVIAWLLTRRAVDTGELSAAEALHPSRRLAAMTGSEAEIVARLPDPARRLAEASIALHRRAAIHDAALAAEGATAAAPSTSPVRSLQAMLASTF